MEPSTNERTAVLTVEDVRIRFGGVTAPSTGSASRWRPGEICGLIGPNGAGKTTMFNGVIAASTSRRRARSPSTATDLLGVPPHGIAGPASPARSRTWRCSRR